MTGAESVYLFASSQRTIRPTIPIPTTTSAKKPPSFTSCHAVAG